MVEREELDDLGLNKYSPRQMWTKPALARAIRLQSLAHRRRQYTYTFTPAALHNTLFQNMHDQGTPDKDLNKINTKSEKVKKEEKKSNEESHS